MEKIRIAIIGTVGIPATYGGFETLAEYLTKHIGDKLQFTVYCSSKAYSIRLKEYNNAQLEYIPLKGNGIQSIPYDIASLFKAAKTNDTILILGVSGCIALPFFRLFYKQKRLIVNIDGLEHRRGKWNGFTKWFLRFSEKMATRYADIIVTDNKGIQDYVSEKYKLPSVLIEYGGDHILRNIEEELQQKILDKYDLRKKSYSLKISRIEPENNCDLIIEAFVKTQSELVFVGNWSRSDYSRTLMKKYQECSNIHFVNSLYDLDELFIIRKHCKFYIHGHSAGGTNPSLVEAMFIGCPILAFNVIYNRETTENRADYFSNEEELRALLNKEESLFTKNGESMIEIAHRRYKWKNIASMYENILS